MRANRFDRSDLKKSEITPQGFLRASAYATRVGVLTYRKADGSVRREARLPEEVFNTDSMKTLANVPLTNQHPKVKGDLLNAKNASGFTVGFTGDVIEQAEEKFLQTRVTVIDANMVAKAKDYELSCGYECDLEDSPGIFNGEAYDVIQRNIVYNHLAMVPKGRAGAEVRIHLDADDAVSTECEGAKAMGKIKIGDKEFDASQEMCDAHGALVKAHEDAMGKMASEMDALKKAGAAKPAGEAGKPTENAPDKTEEADKGKKMDAMQARIDALEAQAQKPADFGKAVSKRVALLETAKGIVAKSVSLDALDDVAIMKECIKADNAKVNLDGKSDAYVEAYFDSIKARRSDAEVAREILGTAIIAGRRKDGAEPDQEKSRADAQERTKAAALKPVGFNMSNIGKK